MLDMNRPARYNRANTESRLNRTRTKAIDDLKIVRNTVHSDFDYSCNSWQFAKCTKHVSLQLGKCSE